MTEPQTVAHVPAADDFDRKAISLTAGFIETAVDDSSVLEGIPQGAILVLLPPEDPALVEESTVLGIVAVRQGRDVTFRHAVLAGERDSLD